MTEFEFMILPYLHPFPEPGSALFMGNFQIHHNFEV
jgi:hypothetical protein